MKSVAAILILSLIAMSCKAISERQSTGAKKSGSENKPLAESIIDGEIEIVQNFILHDTKRNKDLQIRITFPRASGKYPVIVFSHGAWESKDAYQPLIKYWSANGYVCIQADHSDSRNFGGNRKTGTFEDWANRPPDISLIIGALSSLESKIPQLNGKIDHNRIGVGGHSFGGMTAQLIGGVDVKSIGLQQSDFKNDRVMAILLLSPPGTSRMLTRDSWKNLTIPMMNVTGTNDISRRAGKDYTWRKEPYEYSPRGEKFLLVLDGADHGLGGVTGTENRYGYIDNPDQVRIVQKITQFFWDAYLKSSSGAKNELLSKESIKQGSASAVLSNKLGVSQSKTPVPYTGSKPYNERVSPEGASYMDPEFLEEKNLVVFQDGTDNSIWLGKIDPSSGRFASKDGKDSLVDEKVAPIYKSFNGPEFGINKNGWSIYYTKPDAKELSTNQIWRATPSGDTFVRQQLSKGPSHQTAVVQKNVYASSTKVLALQGSWKLGTAVWFDETTPDNTTTFITGRTPETNAEYLPDSSRFLTSIRDKKGNRQIYIIDTDSGMRAQITFDNTDKASTWAWRAPEYNAKPAVLALENGSSIGIWSERKPGIWTKEASLPVPSGTSMTRLKSPEPFVFNNRSYISASLHKSLRGGSGEVWIYSLSEGTAERCDNGHPEGRRLDDPEPFTTDKDVFVFYNAKLGRAKWELWRCEPQITG